MTTDSLRPHPAPGLFALGLFLFYGSLSPGAIHSMGYGDEEVAAAGRLLDVVAAWLHFEPASLAVAVTRHGILEVLLKAPFALLGRGLAFIHPLFAEAPLALVPILATTALVGLLFVWLRQLSGSSAWAWLLAIAAGLTTFLWPYAYLGMETSQSLALLVAGYLALTTSAPPGFRRTLVFALTAGLAVSLKSTGVFLLPAVFYLAVQVVRRVDSRRSRWRHGLLIGGVVLALRAVNAYAVFLHQAAGEQAEIVGRLLIADPFAFVLNGLGFLASPNKGLVLYAPVVVLALLGWRAAIAGCRPVATFALLSFAGLVLGFGLLLVWSEETWGPRYLHSAMAPLVLALGAARAHRPPSLRRDGGLLLAMVAGFVVNVFGVAVYYGTLHVALRASGENTLEAIQYDPGWNPVRFNAWVLGEWLEDPSGARPHTFSPRRTWWSPVPSPERLSPRVDVGPWIRPQPFVLRFWKGGVAGLELLPPFLVATGLAGVLLLGGCGLQAWRSGSCSSLLADRGRADAV